MGRKVATQVGDVYGRLTVLHVETRPSKNGSLHAWVTCQCECGATCEVQAAAIRCGGTKSCGCLRRETMSQRTQKYGDGAKSHDRIYATWNGMRARCTNPKNPSFHHYGGRGVMVCSEWLDYLTFREWAERNGYAPGLTIDRIDNDGNYEPSNCRFITIQEQQSNKRPQAVGTTGPKYEAFGESKTFREWALDPRVTVSATTFTARLRKGWDTEQALIVPVLRLREYRKKES